MYFDYVKDKNTIPSQISNSLTDIGIRKITGIWVRVLEPVPVPVPLGTRVLRVSRVPYPWLI